MKLEYDYYSFQAQLDIIYYNLEFGLQNGYADIKSTNWNDIDYVNAEVLL